MDVADVDARIDWRHAPTIALSADIAACLLPAFFAGARRWPETRIAQMGVSTADRVRDEARVAVESVSAWSRAGRDVARLRKEQFRLRRERDEKVRVLGVAFYSDDGHAGELKAAAKELDERMAANERELQRTVAGARRQTRKGRATVVLTEVIKPDPVTEVVAAQAVEPKPKPAAKKRQARSR